MTRAVVFAYHDVGVRCLSVLLAHRLRIPLVITHRDDAAENIWFGSVAALAELHDLRVAYSDAMTEDELCRELEAARPDFIFSFYYRHMLPPRVLQVAARGAYNMHGSLLPNYRGRAPVNWAILHGERETGATLHRMVAKPDAGEIIDQQAVPILPDDRAIDVFRKVTLAAEMVLDRSLSRLIDGSAHGVPQDPAHGSHYGGRRPEDGRIDWRWPALRIHNLVRAVAPPYPGAFTAFAGGTLRILGTLVEPDRSPRSPRPGLYCEAARCYADCADGGVLRLLELEVDGVPLDAQGVRARYGDQKVFFN